MVWTVYAICSMFLNCSPKLRGMLIEHAKNLTLKSQKEKSKLCTSTLIVVIYCVNIFTAIHLHLVYRIISSLVQICTISQKMTAFNLSNFRDTLIDTDPQ